MIDIAVIVAAWRRGWTLEQIGFAAGVTRERVRQRLERHEEKNGPIERFFKPGRHNTAPARAWKCGGCGRIYWGYVGQIGKYENRVCSTKCYSDMRRSVTDAMVEHAIDLRWSGKTWTSIADELGHCDQTIKSQMWKFLYKIGMLDIETVESIWDPNRGGRYHAWNWLERNTGLVCTENGARLTRPVYRYSNKSPWGARIVRSAADSILDPRSKSQLGRYERRRLRRRQAVGDGALSHAAARGVEDGTLSDRGGEEDALAPGVRGAEKVDAKRAAKPSLESEG